MTNSDDNSESLTPEPVRILRARLRRARRENTSIHDGAGLNTERLIDLTNGLSYLVDAFGDDAETLTQPLLVAVARALLGEDVTP